MKLKLKRNLYERVRTILTLFYMPFLRWQNYGDSKMTVWFWGLKKKLGEISMGSTTYFQGSEAILFDIMVNTRYICQIVIIQIQS